jgi:diguanylate cyclase (GGDEF)-like protein
MRIQELEKKVRCYEAENKRLADIQQKLAEVTNNYLMLHYLNKNIQDCGTSEELWKVYLHNISDKGFNYNNVAVFLPDEQGLFTLKYFLKDNKLCMNQVEIDAIDKHINQVSGRRESVISFDKRKAAIPMVNPLGVLKAVLAAEKESGFTVEDLELLGVYVQQTIATIENITLNERLLQYQNLLGKRLDQFVLLHYLAKEINDGTDFYDILRKYLRALQSPIGFNFQDSKVYILDEQAIKRASLVGEELYMETVDTVEPLIADAMDKKCGVLSATNKVLVMPLLTGGKVSAVIEVVSEKVIELEQVQILEIFAMQTSSVLDNARLRMNLEYMSFHDTLTGLYNRTFFEKHFRQLKARQDISVGMMMCDVNKLKYVNDMLGHYAGDALIIAAAKAIKDAIDGGNAIAARIGGDEFAVLAAPCLESDLAVLYEEIRGNMQQFNRNEFFTTLEMAMGWAYAEANADLDELLRRADRNMYEEKKKSKIKM